METSVAIVSMASAIITALISAVAYFRGKREEEKAKLNEVKKTLARQVIAYYCEEQILLAELSTATGRNAETLKKEMRQKAAEHPKNTDNVPPSMYPATAKNYL